MNIEKAQQKLEELLAPYGYYFARKGDETRLPLTFADLGIVALTLLSWGAFEYLKAFIQEKGKVDAQDISGKDNLDEKYIRKIVHDTLHELLGIVQHLQVKQRLYEIEINSEALAQRLIELGMSKRTAQKAAIELKPVLESEIRLLILGDK